jgi:hypothetical protein
VLDLDGAPHGLDGTGEFGEKAITHKLDDTAFVLGDLGLD